MKIYEVEITETLNKVEIVWANSAEEAREKVKQDYREEKIVLDYNNFQDVEIEVIKGE